MSIIDRLIEHFVDKPLQPSSISYPRLIFGSNCKLKPNKALKIHKTTRSKRLLCCYRPESPVGLSMGSPVVLPMGISDRLSEHKPLVALAMATLLLTQL